MKLTKKEKTMILILAILVYAFAFVKFVLLTNIPKIKEANITLEQTKAQLAALEADYQNLETFKADIKAKTVTDERLGEYLMDNAGLSDSISFIENLALMMGSELKSISLGTPTQVKQGDLTYYGFPVKFSTVFNYENFQKIIEYCEAASRKVQVASFDIKLDEEASDELFNVNMQLVFYSLDKAVADNMYRFSRSSFSQFRNDEGVPVFIKDDAVLPDTQAPEPNKVSEGDIKPETVEITRKTADYVVFFRGFLYAGYNFETFASFNPSKVVREKVTGKMDVVLKITDNSYSFVSVDNQGKQYELSGTAPNRNFTFFIESDINPDTEENDNLNMNLKIQNDSGNNVRVKMVQKSNRIKLMDRDGNEIKGENKKEKVYIS